MSSGRRFGLGILIFALLVTGAGEAVAQPADLLAAAYAQGSVRVIARLHAPHVLPEAALGADAHAVLAQRLSIVEVQDAALSSLAGTTYRLLWRYTTSAYLGLEVTPDALRALAASAFVEEITEDFELRPQLGQSGPLIQADLARALGAIGSGQAVVIIDSGVDRTHPFTAGRVVDEWCFVSSGNGCPGGPSGPGAASPVSSHGTHVAGIAAGLGGGGSLFWGVAPGASIVAIKVLSPSGTASFLDVKAALDRVILLKETRAIAAVNMSLAVAGTPFAAACDATDATVGGLKADIDTLRNAGIATVVPTGNDASSTGLAYPACISSTIKVGATTKGDTVAPYSNRAPALEDTTLLAPGGTATGGASDICSGIVWLVESTCGNGDLGARFARLAGTSIAAPHVTGAWAVLKQVKPSATVDEVLAALRATALPVVDPATDTTYRRIRIRDAITALTGQGGGQAASPASGPSIALDRATAPLTGPVVATLTNGRGGFEEWAGVFRVGDPGTNGAWVDWQWLSGGHGVHGQPSGGTLTFPFNGRALPAGAYVIKWVASNGALISQSEPFTLTAAPSSPPVVLSPTVQGPTIMLDRTLAPPAGPVVATLSGGGGGFEEWVGVFRAGDPGTNGAWIDWQWLSGGRGIHGQPAGGTLTFPVNGQALPAGDYVIKWVASSGALIAQSATFTLADVPAAPVVTALAPGGVVAGAPAFTLRVLGTGFLPGSVIRVDGVDRTTTFVSPTELRAEMTAAEIATVGVSHAVTVATPPVNGQGGGVSGALVLNAVAPPPVPAISGLSPATAGAGGAGFTLTVHGTSFVPASVVRLNGADRVTTFVSPTQLQAAISAADLAVAGSATITVVTPAPGGGTSAGASLSIQGPTITLDRAVAPLGGPLVATMTNGRGTFEEWVGVFREGEPGTNGVWVDWQWLSGGHGIHGQPRGGTLTFPFNGRALPAGRYVIKWVASNGTLIAQSAPFTLAPAGPLLQPGNLAYVGAFRLPQGFIGSSTFSFGGTALTYNPANNSLFLVGHDFDQQVAEVGIPPQIVNSTSLDDLTQAPLLQGFADPTEGRLASVGAPVPETKIGGLLVHDGKLYGSGFISYDAGHTQTLSHFSSGLDLSAPGDALGMVQVGNVGAGFVSGYMASVPAEWQTALGGPALTGNCCLAVVSRTSYGPALFAFDPAAVASGDQAPATPLLYYPSEHPLADWDSNSPLFNGNVGIAGVVLPGGSRSVLFFGRRGTGPFCYGVGEECNDPIQGEQGTHGYPYIYQVWAYDALDLAAVKAGQKAPWEVQPYATWRLSLPFPPGPRASWHLGGAAWDPQTRRLYISQMLADSDGMDRYNPLIHVFEVVTPQ